MQKSLRRCSFQDNDVPANKWGRMMAKEEIMNESEMEAILKNQLRGRGKKKHNNKSPEVMAMRRRKIWVMMSKKELGKVQRAKINNHKEMLISCKKVAQHCMKYWRHKAMQVKNSKPKLSQKVPVSIQFFFHSLRKT